MVTVCMHGKSCMACYLLFYFHDIRLQYVTGCVCQTVPSCTFCYRYMLQAQNKDVYLVPAHVAAAVMVSMAGVCFDADGSSTHELQLNASYYRWAALVLAKSNNQQQQACALAHKLDEVIKPLLEAHHGHLMQNTGEVCQAALQQVWSAVRRELSVVTPDTVGAAAAEADEDEGAQDQSATLSGIAKPQAAVLGVGAEKDDKESEQQLQQSDDATSSQVDQQLFQAIALLTGVGRKRVMDLQMLSSAALAELEVAAQHLQKRQHIC